ncbi:hypothetical protein Hanom_Chr10g00965181 [Helianthus anomalus]
MKNVRLKLFFFFCPWLYSLVASWWWDNALGQIGPGFDSHTGVFPCLLGFLLNWCGIMPSGDGYDRVVPLVARCYSSGPSVIQNLPFKKNYYIFEMVV